MIKAVILDFDGTLASTVKGIYACMAETFVTFGYPRPTPAEVRLTVGLTLDQAMRQLANDRCDEGAIQSMIATYRDLHRQKAAAMASLFEGTLETLTFLRARGIQSIVVSNRSRRGLHHLTEHLGIKDRLDVMLGADEVPYQKPDARLFTDVIVPLLAGAEPPEVLMVGDTEWDLLFARNAGLRSCWASYGYGDVERCRALNPNYVISAIGDLRNVVVL